MPKIYRQGRLSADKVEYPDGVIYCCIWYPLDAESDEWRDVGACFDFDASDIGDMIALLRLLQEVPPDRCEQEQHDIEAG